jgi:hypothetical protein
MGKGKGAVSNESRRSRKIAIVSVSKGGGRQPGKTGSFVRRIHLSILDER